MPFDDFSFPKQKVKTGKQIGKHQTVNYCKKSYDNINIEFHRHLFEF